MSVVAPVARRLYALAESWPAPLLDGEGFVLIKMSSG